MCQGILTRCGATLLLIISFLLVGCAHDNNAVIHLTADPGLDLKQLNAGGVAILPAVRSSPLFSDNLVSRAELEKSLIAVRPAFTPLPVDTVTELLRKHPEVELTLQSYAKTGNIKPQQLRDFGPALGVRFVVILNLLEFRVGAGDQPPSQHEQAFFGVIFRDSIEAKLIGTLGIIDTAAPRPVWLQTVEVRREVRNEVEVPATFNGRSWHASAWVPIATAPPPEALLPEFLAAIVTNWPR